MKTSSINSCAAMSRAEFLLVVGVVLLAVFITVHFQRTGDVFQVDWGKSKPRPTATQTVSVVEAPRLAMPSDSQTNVSNVQINLNVTNIVKQEKKPGRSSGNGNVQLVYVQKQKVVIATNTVRIPIWQRKLPGVRIAFP